MDGKLSDDSKSQQSQHIITPQGKTDDNKPSPISAMKRAQEKRKNFERRMMFNSALDKGKSTVDAARYAGEKVEPGESLTSTEIMDLKYHGKPIKKRSRL